MLTTADNRTISRDRVHAIISQQTALELILAANTAHEYERNQLLALAGRIQLCNDPSNSWFIPDLYENGQDPKSDGIGRFWRCNSKLCSACLARNSRMNRNKLRHSIAAQPKLMGYRLRFITLTIPTPDLPLVETRAIVQTAWSKFRKRSLCVALIRGGAKSEEFTVTKNGFHYHLHLLVYAKWISQKELRKVWTSCVKSAYIDHERAFSTNTEHGELVVDIRQVTNTEKSIRECAKYITKTANWNKLNRRDLIDIAMIPKWHRMFEMFGSFALRNTQERVVNKPFLDTESLTDGASPSRRQHWREYVQNADVEMYLLALEEKIAQAREFGINQLRNRFPNHHIILLDCIV